MQSKTTSAVRLNEPSCRDRSEVYPLKDYGAVEIGVHRFHHPTHPEEGVGEAKFITLWENKNGTWKISRAISFDHENVKK